MPHGHGQEAAPRGAARLDLDAAACHRRAQANGPVDRDGSRAAGPAGRWRLLRHRLARAGSRDGQGASGRQAAEARRLKAEEEAAKLRAESEQRQKAEAERQKAEEIAAARQRQETAEAAAKKQFEEETRRKIETEITAQKRAEEEAKRKADEEAEARRKAVEEARKAVEFVAGQFDHFGKTLMMIGLKDRPDEIRLQGVDVVNDPDLQKVAVSALAAQPRDLRCRQTDRLTDGTPLYRCLISPLNAKPPLADVPDSTASTWRSHWCAVGLLLASCDAPRSYADAEDDARGRKQALWGRVTVQEYKRRCTK